MTSLRVNRSGTALMAVSPGVGAAKIWDLRGPPGARPLELGWGQYISEAAFHPNGEWVASAGAHGVALWPLARAYPYVLDDPDGGTLQLALAPDGRWLASAGLDGVVRFWQRDPAVSLWRTVRLQPREDVQNAILALAVAANGERLYAGSFGGALWSVSLRDGTPMHLTSVNGQLTALAVDPAGRVIAGAVSNRRGEKWGSFIRLWDIQTGDAFDLESSAGDHDLAFTPDGVLVAAGATGLRLWDPNRRRWQRLRDDEVSIVDMTADGRYLVASGWKQGVTLHDRLVGTTRQLGPQAIVALDPGGQWFAAARESTIEIHPTGGGAPHLLFGHHGSVHDLEVTPDGRWIVSAAGDGTIRLWSLPSGAPFQTLPREEVLARLAALTNLRLVPDDLAVDGFRVELDRFPGWRTTPTW